MFNFVYAFVSVWGCVHLSSGAQGGHECQTPGAGVTGGLEPRHMSAGRSSEG